MNTKSYIKGRGAQAKVANHFFEHHHEIRDDFLEYCLKEDEDPDPNQTKYLEIFPKTIVNKITSPDVRMMHSMNAYQGCEHGCIYCYARNTHEFWGYGPGLDFERNILVKKNAPELLEKLLQKKSWIAQTIVMSGNTDCYQPAEKTYGITRSCLEIFLKYKHPVGIITKNSLILRDLDLYKELAKENLIGVNISITTLSEETRRAVEPRTATIKKRLEAVKILSENGIPVNIMLAPIIPSINSHEILPLIKAASEHGALSVAHTVVRLNGPIGKIFTEWIRQRYPDRADKVLHQIESCHGGKLNDSRIGKRIRGDGEFADQIAQMVSLGKKLYFKGKQFPELNCNLHDAYKDGQLKLF